MQSLCSSHGGCTGGQRCPPRGPQVPAGSLLVNPHPPRATSCPLQTKQKSARGGLPPGQASLHRPSCLIGFSPGRPLLLRKEVWPQPVTLFPPSLVFLNRSPCYCEWAPGSGPRPRWPELPGDVACGGWAGAPRGCPGTCRPDFLWLPRS